MEFWVSKADYGLILFSEPYHSDKNKYHSANPNIPSLQYSITPVFHHSTAYEYGIATLLFPGPKNQVFRTIIKMLV